MNWLRRIKWLETDQEIGEVVLYLSLGKEGA